MIFHGEKIVVFIINGSLKYSNMFYICIKHV